MCETKITVDSLKERLAKCKTMENYQALIDACVISTVFFKSKEERRIIYGIIEDCAAAYVRLSMSPAEQAEVDSGWDMK